MNIIEIILCTALLGIGSSRVEGWKGIVPLHSRRADVERLLGQPTKPCKNVCDYGTKSETVSVVYSGEPCDKGDENRWRVPPDTVINLSVYAEVKPKLSALRLNRRKFTKTQDPELRGYFEYTNEDEGVSYEVSDTGTIMGSHWFPASKDEALRCPNAGATGKK